MPVNLNRSHLTLTNEHVSLKRYVRSGEHGQSIEDGGTFCETKVS